MSEQHLLNGPQTRFSTGPMSLKACQCRHDAHLRLLELLSHSCQAAAQEDVCSLETRQRRQDLVPPAAPPKGDLGSRARNAHVDHPRVLCRGGPESGGEFPLRVLRQQLLQAGRQETVWGLCRCMCALKVPSGASASSSRRARQGTVMYVESPSSSSVVRKRVLAPAGFVEVPAYRQAGSTHQAGRWEA